MWFAVCQGDICGIHRDKYLLEKAIDQICEQYPELFRKEYISIMSEVEYEIEFGKRA